MIKMIEGGVAYSPAKLPNLNAAVYPTVIYDHTAHRTSATTMDLSITVKIGIKVANSEKQSFKVMNATSKFKFETDDKLTLDVLYKAWSKSFDNIYVALLKVLYEAGLPKMNIKFDSKESLTSTIQPILSMFNETKYIENYTR